MKQPSYHYIFKSVCAAFMALVMVVPVQAELNILDATMGETDPSPEVSTAQVRQFIKDGGAVVLDSRRMEQYAAGHIPDVAHIDLKAGTPEYIAEIDKLLGGDRSNMLVLYCNGPNCGASRSLAGLLVEKGFTNVHRYQLGIPMWRTMGGPTVMELEGVVRIYDVDRTTVYFDARSPADYEKGTIPGAHSVPTEQIADNVLGSAPKPGQDMNTRVVIFGKDGAQARELAEEMGKSPYHNVNYYPGTFESLQKAIHEKMHKHK
ncbi:MAG: sulfur transferase [Gammaproteobacteria bacterium]|nr:sulfur transferase [Gammaproteobacteria bacterium]